TPFTLRVIIDDKGPHFDACAADNETGRSRIQEAAVRAGAAGTPDCTLALGAPTPDWADAAVAAIQAVAALGRGSVTISDAEIALSAPTGTNRDRLDEVVGNLEQALPRMFSLKAQQEQAADADQGPVEFAATLDDGDLTIRGRIADQRMREAVDSFARARFAKVQGNLRSDETVPSGWTVRVIAALEAIAVLDDGQARVTPDLVRLNGTSGDPRATDRAASLLARRLGAGAAYELSIRYDRRLDPELGLPDGEECVGRLNIIMSESEMGFEPSKATIAGDPAPTLDKLAEVMKDCASFRIEAGGHTDSQGSEGFNASLSRSRAQALVKAMGEAGIDIVNVTARGYGESQPIASNDSDAGREANRRIEFRLVSDIPVQNEPLPAPVTVSGVTNHADSVGATAETLTIPPYTAAGPEKGGPEDTGGEGKADQPLDAAGENTTVPVQIADETTPRPAPRPASDQTGDSDTAAP
ncbi:OmpA family protein, partial [Paracoccus sp. (in: a-proteobacteria)]|uniref:OmpA family protein n=1 Tax=Paracoccus sp. TaxID=267 RepID=UPI003A8B50E7